MIFIIVKEFVVLKVMRAPLEENEIAIIEDIIDIVKPYMSPQGVRPLINTELLIMMLMEN